MLRHLLAQPEREGDKGAGSCLRGRSVPPSSLHGRKIDLSQEIVVLHETCRGSRRVAACSPAARGRGVAIGMTICEAAAILGDQEPPPKNQRGRRWRLAAHDPLADRQALERLGVWCHRFSPLVGLDGTAEPDSLLADVTGVARFFGGEQALADRILGPFTRRGIPIRIGLADTVGAAWAAARYSESGKRKGAGSPVAIIPPGQAEAALDAMPLEALRLSAGVLDLLEQLGVRRIGELALLPRADFNARFGPELLQSWDRATGRLDEPITALPLPRRFEAEQFFEFPTDNRLILEAALEQLVGRVAGMAAIAGRGVLRIDGYFDCQNAGRVRFNVGLFRPTASARHLFGLLRMRLQRLILPGKVEMLRVEITETARLENGQAELFQTAASEREERPSELVDRLASRLGRGAILGVSLRAEAQPELAYDYAPLVGANRARRGSRPASRDLPPRPLRLLPHPIELQAAAVVPDGPPLHFLLWGDRQRVAKAWGPERIETGWWRGSPALRDYYRVETVDGSRFWLFRRRTDGQWFLHGMFG
ncbi:MAG: Y-family DNA polymerase [Thermoguttaceae bacterium]